jgi:hypothetical protein
MRLYFLGQEILCDHAVVQVNLATGEHGNVRLVCD